MSRSFPLNSGGHIPAIALGTWRSAKGVVGAAVRAALDAGYRHIDCAFAYENEDEIGEVFQEYFSGPSPKIRREEVFVTSKLWNTFHSPADVPQAIEKSLQSLKLDYLDLYLVHWPLAWKASEYDPIEGAIDETGAIALDDVTINDTWKAMESLFKAKKAKAIGVSNFNITRLQHLFQTAEIKPAVNQVELHPFLGQPKLLDFCTQQGIHLSAYSPLGSGLQPSLLDEPVVQSVAKKNGKTPSQVLLAWGVQRGTSVLPKSVKPERIAENLGAANFVLPQEDFDAVSALDKNQRLVDITAYFGVNVFAEEGEEGFKKL